MIKAKLLKPLDGHVEGAEREFSQGDFDRLVRRRAVIAVGGVADAKSAPPVLNKKAPAVANKAAVKKAD